MESFVEIFPDSHFSLENLPFGVAEVASDPGHLHPCIALGDSVVDLRVLQSAGCFTGPYLCRHQDCFQQDTLNAFISLGRSAWREARQSLQRLLRSSEGLLRDNSDLLRRAVLPTVDVRMALPCAIGGYTDFYASRQHATNVGTMFRGPENALNPNWLHLPVGYHGRASSIVPSGTPMQRPWGQVLRAGSSQPIVAPSAAVDYELEVAAVMGPGNDMGCPVPVDAVADHIFGLVLMNDWSARDIQKWEYVPLGPFNGKNWGTQISPWIVTLDALEPFKCNAPAQDDPQVLPYLREGHRHTWDVQLTASLACSGSGSGSGGGDGGGGAGGSAGAGGGVEWEGELTSTNLKHLYWTFPQMVAHHTLGGCNLRPGDLLGSGTISGDAEEERGCLLERTWGGTNAVQVRMQRSRSSGADAASVDGSHHEDVPEGAVGAGGVVERKYLLDGDELVLRGSCQRQGCTHIGFGECRGRLLPAVQL